MPYPVPFAWTRLRQSPEASGAYQQTEGLRVTVWEPVSDVQLFTAAANWLTQGYERDWAMRIWYARGIYDGKTIPSLTVQAYALGTANSQGKEIVDNDYILARIGAAAYAGIGSSPLTLFSDETPTNSYVDVDFRLAVPNGASTEGEFFVGLDFETEEDTPWFDDGDFIEFGTIFDAYQPSTRLRLHRSDILVSGYIYTQAQRTAIEAGGLTFPSDAAI